MEEKKIIILDGILDIRSNQTFILFTYGEMDTIKLVYTQLEAFDLVDEYTEAYKKKIKELEEENINLKEEVKKWKMVADENGTHYDMLEEENKKLKEKVRFLEECLDRKEKLNKGYREDVDYWHHRCMVAERGGEDED